MFELFGTDIEFTVSMSLDPWVSILHWLEVRVEVWVGENSMPVVIAHKTTFYIQ